MTYRAPVNDMLFMMRHVGRLDGAMRDGIYPDLSIDLVQDILPEAARFWARCWRRSTAPATATAHGCRRHRHHGAGFQGGLSGLGRRRLERTRRSGRAWRTGPAAAHQCRLLRDVERRCLAFGVAPLLNFGGVEAVAAHGSRTQAKLPGQARRRRMDGDDVFDRAAGRLGPRRHSHPRRARGDGSYRIHGQKIFISYGEHDLTDNIIHLVLARLPGAPNGTRGSRCSWCRKCCQTGPATMCGAVASSTSSESTRARPARWSTATAAAPSAGCSARSIAGSPACSP